MGMHCKKMMGLHHRHHGDHVCPVGPMLVVASTVAMGVGTIISLCMLERLTRALEIMAMVGTLDEMEDHLSDVERADLEGRIRTRMFPG